MPQREKTALDILEGARRLLLPRYRWTKGKAVRLITEEGERPAYCYCLDGAVRRAAGSRIYKSIRGDGEVVVCLDATPRLNEEALGRAQAVLDMVVRRNPERKRAYPPAIAPPRVSFNDADPTNHEDILSVVEEAIQEEKESA